MKLKLVIVDLEIPQHVKKRLLRIGVPVATLLICGGVALAAGLHTWSDGDTLNAADLNGNFAALTPSVTTGKFNGPQRAVGTGVLEKYTAGTPFLVESITLTAPAAGVVTVSTDGQIYDWEHTSGTTDTVTCSLAPNSANLHVVTGSVPVVWNVGQEVPSWSPIGDPFSMPFAASFPFSVPAAGSYEFDFTCYAVCKDVTTSGTFGCDIPDAHIYAVYLPATFTAN